MLQRITTGWNFQRALYVIMGLYVVIQSALNKEWLGFVLGAYLASMGLFALGCAGGACYTNPMEKKDTEIKNVEFEEIKKK